MATFKQVIAKSLECSVCLNIFDHPKCLPCSHTFCQACVQRLRETQPDLEKLRCPICREMTTVPEGGVSHFQSSLTLDSLLDDIKNHSQNCTSCTDEENSPAVVFCQICNKYMCISCEKIHSEREAFQVHKVDYINGALLGKVPFIEHRQCQKHPTENEECFCTDCRHYVCFRCAVIEHARDRHRIIEATEHETNITKHIEELNSNADVKLDSIKAYTAFVDEQLQRIEKKFLQVNSDIENAYEASIRRLRESKEALTNQIKQIIQKLRTKLQDMIDASLVELSHINAVKELVNHGKQVPLEKDALTAHDTLCQELEGIVGRNGPDYDPSIDVASVGEKLSFQRNQGLIELGLGTLRGIDFKWVCKTDSPLPVKDSMNTISATSDGKMAVGCHKGGIHLFSTDGQLQQTVMKDVRVMSINALPDGRWVVRDMYNVLSLYTPQCEKLDVRFENFEGGFGDVTVDYDNQIYVSYRKMRTIQLFAMADGKSVRNISCEYEPRQIFALRSRMLLVRNANNISCIDALTGNKKYNVNEPNTTAWPAVCSDDSIIVAWVKHDEGLVSIDRYTCELKHVRNLFTDYKIEKPKKRNWYYLQEFQSGEVAFCTPDKLYIFTKICV